MNSYVVLALAASAGVLLQGCGGGGGGGGSTCSLLGKCLIEFQPDITKKEDKATHCAALTKFDSCYKDAVSGCGDDAQKATIKKSLDDIQTNYNTTYGCGGGGSCTDLLQCLTDFQPDITKNESVAAHCAAITQFDACYKDSLSGCSIDAEKVLIKRSLGLFNTSYNALYNCGGGNDCKHLQQCLTEFNPDIGKTEDAAVHCAALTKFDACYKDSLSGCGDDAQKASLKKSLDEIQSDYNTLYSCGAQAKGFTAAATEGSHTSEQNTVV